MGITFAFIQRGQRTGVYFYFHEEHGVTKEADNFEEWLNQLPTYLN